MPKFCPVCHNTEYTIIGKPRTNEISSEFIKKDYNVVQCSKCQTYYVYPEIDFTDEQWSKLYHSEYFADQPESLLKKRAKELEQRLDKAERFIGKNKDIKLLDIGTGEGKTLAAGLQRGWRVTGIDIVDNRNPEAKNNGVEFIQGKFMEYDFPENYFDFIYLDSVLEHVLNPLEYLKKIRNILKPGGILYVGTPDEDNLFNVLKKLALRLRGKKDISVKTRPFDFPYHVVGFNPHSFKYIIDKSGLRIKYFRNFSRKFAFLYSPVSSRVFWISLIFLFPIEIIGNLIRKDLYFEAYLTKDA